MNTSSVGRTLERQPHSWLLYLAAVFSFLLSPFVAAGDDPRIAASQSYAQQLQQQLGAELMAAMQQGGPVSAIDVCQVRAPRIAAELSSTGNPSRVGRTAVKWRNPDNAPDAEALEVLEQFSQSLQAGEKPPLTRFTTRPDGSARFMQTIITQPQCLACHGETLGDDVQAAMAERYPEDHATGFKAGDLRGAFVIDWPAAAGG